MQIPLFIEVLHSAQSAPIQVCRKVIAGLFKQGISPLPFAGSIEELRTVLSSLKQKGIEPGLFVINTYWAEEVLEQLDPFLGNSPVLFFVRDMITETPSTRSQVFGDSSNKTTTLLQRMTPRAGAIWTFGSRSAETAAAHAVTSIANFLNDGDFYHIERHAPMLLSQLQAGRKPEPAAPAEVAPRVTSARTKRFSFEPHDTPKPQPVRGLGMQGELRQLGLSSLLMMLEMENKSGELTLQREAETLRMILQKGRVALASNMSATASIPQGIESIYYALTWLDGRFDFQARDTSDIQNQINAQTTQLLMESARRRDEPARSAS